MTSPELSDTKNIRLLNNKRKKLKQNRKRYFHLKHLIIDQQSAVIIE